MQPTPALSGGTEDINTSSKLKTQKSKLWSRKATFLKFIVLGREKC